jgi:hypothetical protein
MLVGRKVVAERLTMAKEARVPGPSNDSAGVVTPNGCGPDNVEAVDEVIRYGCAKPLNPHLAVRLPFDCLEVSIDKPVLARHKVAFFTAVALGDGKPPAAQRRIFRGPTGIVLHPRNITKE